MLLRLVWPSSSIALGHQHDQNDQTPGNHRAFSYNRSLRCQLRLWIHRPRDDPWQQPGHGQHQVPEVAAQATKISVALTEALGYLHGHRWQPDTGYPVAFGGNMSHGCPHRHWLWWDNRYRHSPWQQPWPRGHHGLRCRACLPRQSTPQCFHSFHSASFHSTQTIPLLSLPFTHHIFALQNRCPLPRAVGLQAVLWNSSHQPWPLGPRLTCW